MEKKSHIYAAIGTVVFTGILLVILLFCGMSCAKEEKLEGLMVSFGDESEGWGEPTTVVENSSASDMASTNENMLTQEDESVALETEKNKEREKERQQQEAEKERLRHEANARVAGAFSSSASQTSQGTTTGESMSGNPMGKGNSGGHSWSLAGRSLLGSLLNPVYSGSQEGRVVVSIRVDSNGNVTDTKIAKGTTISDAKLLEASQKAARKAKFTEGKSVAMGEIVYRFVLN